MKTADDAPVHLGLPEAEQWASGFNSAVEKCAEIAMERGGADGLIIAALIRQLIEPK